MCYDLTPVNMPAVKKLWPRTASEHAFTLPRPAQRPLPLPLLLT